MNLFKPQPQYCQLGNIHQGEELQFICLEFQCRKSNLACVICKQQFHAKHQCITLSNFVNELQRKQFFFTENDVLNINSDPGPVFNQCLQNIQKFREYCNSKIKKAEELLKIYFQNFKKQQQYPDMVKKGFGCILLELLQVQSDPEHLNQAIYGILNRSKIQGQKITQIPKDVLITDNGQEEFNEFLQKFQPNLKYTHQKFSEDLQKIIDVIPKQNQNLDNQYYYYSKSNQNFNQQSKANYFSSRSNGNIQDYQIEDNDQYDIYEIKKQKLNVNQTYNQAKTEINDSREQILESHDNQPQYLSNNNTDRIFIQNEYNLQQKQSQQQEQHINQIIKSQQQNADQYIKQNTEGPEKTLYSVKSQGQTPKNTLQRFFMKAGFNASNHGEQTSVKESNTITKYKQVNLNNLSQALSQLIQSNFSKSQMIDPLKEESVLLDSNRQNNSGLESQTHKSNNQNQQTTNSKQTNKKFRFSNILRHKFVIISNNQQSCSSNSQSNSVKLALAEPSVEQRPQREVSWQFKIIKCKSMAVTQPLAIGICHQNIASRNKFTFDVEEPEQQSQNLKNSLSADKFMNKPEFFKRQEKHGCYLLSQNGVIRNDYDKKQDMKFSPLRFNEGDIINCSYSPFRSTIQFQRMGTEQICILNIQVGCKDMLFPCVRLSFAGDMVEIINN